MVVLGAMAGATNSSLDKLSEAFEQGEPEERDALREFLAEAVVQEREQGKEVPPCLILCGLSLS